ncbi:MAG: HD domain-containing phosphohydrolase [Geminicoccaceae bacterium]
MNHIIDIPTSENVSASPSVWRFLGAAALCVAIGLAAARFSVDTIVAERRTAMENQLGQRLLAEAGGRSELISTWIDGLSGYGNRLLRSDLVRLFVTETGLGQNDAELRTALQEQEPYMVQVLDDLAREHDLRGVYLLGVDGRSLLSDGDAPVVTGEQVRHAARLVETGEERHVSPPARHGDRYFMDLMQAIAPAQSYSDDARPVGVLLMTFDVTAMLEKLLSIRPLIDAGSSVRLDVGDAGGWRRIALEDGRLVEIDGEPAVAIPAASMRRDGELYRLTLPVEDMDWRVEQRMDAATALATIHQFEKNAYVFATAAALILALLFASFFWRLQSRHHAAMARQYMSLAEQIRARNELLRTVTDHTLDFIALKGTDGRYELVSQSFAKGFGRTADALTGLGDSDLFDPHTCARIADGEREAFAVGVSQCDDILIGTGDDQRHMHVVQVPVGEDDDARRILMVARDITELVRARADRERLSRQTVDAFIRAVELVDPYLEGHTKRLCALTSRLAEHLGLDATRCQTVQLAAGLSQIGKMFVPRDIVAKPDRHTREEARVMRTHIDHARRVLDSIQFGLPVAEAVSQMHERLDGSGYPQKLAGDRIGMAGRILAVADVYCARTSPRSYREHLDPADVIHHLRNATGRYDTEVIDALETLVREIPDEDDPQRPRGRTELSPA